jgi:hypothetical protein
MPSFMAGLQEEKLNRKATDATHPVHDAKFCY